MIPKIKTTILAIAACSSMAGAAAAETTLKWGEHLPQCCSMYTAAAQWAVKETAARSKGDLKININYGGVLATVGEIPTAIENGVIDMGNLVTPYFPDQFVINNAIPFFWPQPKSQQALGELMLKWHKEIPAFGNELAKYKLKLVAVRPLPPYGLICNKPIRTLQDFKGKRIRSYGVALPAMLEALGAVSVGMPDVEAYEALSNNILDCSAADIALVDAFKLNEVAKYFIDVPMGASWGHIIVMNTNKYASLSADQKKVIDSLQGDHLNGNAASVPCEGSGVDGEVGRHRERRGHQIPRRRIPEGDPWKPEGPGRPQQLEDSRHCRRHACRRRRTGGERYQQLILCYGRRALRRPHLFAFSVLPSGGPAICRKAGLRSEPGSGLSARRTKQRRPGACGTHFSRSMKTTERACGRLRCSPGFRPSPSCASSTPMPSRASSSTGRCPPPSRSPRRCWSERSCFPSLSRC